MSTHQIRKLLDDTSTALGAIKRDLIPDEVKRAEGAVVIDACQVRLLGEIAISLGDLVEVIRNCSQYSRKEYYARKSDD